MKRAQYMLGPAVFAAIWLAPVAPAYADDGWGVSDKSNVTLDRPERWKVTKLTEHEAATTEKRKSTEKPVRVVSERRHKRPGGTFVVVRRGDTLSEIGARYGVSWRRLADRNGIDNPDLIFAGTTLRVR